MRKSTLIACLLSLAAFGQSALAANWTDRVEPYLVIETSPENLDIDVISGGRLTGLGNYIGNTGAGTTISLGEVDFGASGSIVGASIALGSGWGDDNGTGVLKIDGYKDGEGTEIARVGINRTNAYDCFDEFYNTLSRKVSGKHALYLVFEGRCGNVKSVSLYNKKVPADQVTAARGGNYRVLNPWEFDGYTDGIIRCTAEEATNISGSDAHIDTNNGSWGWVHNDLTIEFPAKDFGEGGWQQVALEFNHGDASYDHYLEVYLDEVADANLVAKFWNGWNLGGNFYFAGKALKNDITGEHKVLVRWKGAGGNLRTVDFYKEIRYSEAPYFDLQATRENYKVADDAKHITFTGATAAEYQILSTNGDPRIEGNGNIGYTSNGTVFKFKNIDFGENQFKNIVVDAAREEKYTGSPRSARYDIYIDLEEGHEYTSSDWNDRLDVITEGHETVARPYLQGTGSWGTRMNTMSPLAPVSGVHDLYFVMRTNGANVYGIYMEYNDEVVVDPTPTVTIPEIALSIPTSESNPEVEIIEGAAYPESCNYIGNVGGGTKIALGTVDFGTDDFKAVSVEIANGWYIDNSFAVLYAGDSWEASLPFVQVALEETGDYNRNWNLYASNFTCNEDDVELWSGGTEAVEGIEYVKPEGVQNIYIEFVNGGGNLRSVNFYADELEAVNLAKNENADLLLRPDAYDEYARDYALIVNATDSKAINANGDTPRLDGDSWGWTNGVKGFMADFGTVDFGNGEYAQVAINFKHWRDNPDDYVEIYIDEANDDNLIARFFTGLNLDNNLTTVGADIPAISGEHKVIVKWDTNTIGSGTNVRQVHFVKASLWPAAGDNGFTTENYEPKDDATLINFANTNSTILHRGQMEGTSNIGWTGNGTTFIFHNVDFGNKAYNKIIVEHSNPSGYVGTKDKNNIKFYLADEFNTLEASNWSNNDTRNEMLSAVDPVATVRIQGSNGWSNRTKASAPLAEVVGIHDVVVVMTSQDDGTACNLFNVWLENNAGNVGVDEVEAEGVSVAVADGAIILSGAARVYNLQGALIADTAEAASVNVAAGVYIVRTADSVVKVAVR